MQSLALYTTQFYIHRKRIKCKGFLKKIQKKKKNSTFIPRKPAAFAAGWIRAWFGCWGGSALRAVALDRGSASVSPAGLHPTPRRVSSLQGFCLGWLCGLSSKPTTVQIHPPVLLLTKVKKKRLLFPAISFLCYLEISSMDLMFSTPRSFNLKRSVSPGRISNGVFWFLSVFRCP